MRVRGGCTYVCVCVQVADPVGKSFTCIYSEACFSQTTLATMVPKKCHGVSDFVFFFTQVRTSAAPSPHPLPSHHLPTYAAMCVYVWQCMCSFVDIYCLFLTHNMQRTVSLFERSRRRQGSRGSFAASLVEWLSLLCCVASNDAWSKSKSSLKYGEVNLITLMNKMMWEREETLVLK